MMWASMVAAGNGHGLRIRVFGEKASLHWDQEQPDELHLRADNAPYRTLRRGEAYLCEAARHASRTKTGNPEGLFRRVRQLLCRRGRGDRRAPRGPRRQPECALRSPLRATASSR